jgi:hypothetical protein
MRIYVELIASRAREMPAVAALAAGVTLGLSACASSPAAPSATPDEINH